GLARVFYLVVASRRRSRGNVQHKSQLWAGPTPQPTVASRDVVARRHALMSRRVLLPGCGVARGSRGPGPVARGGPRAPAPGPRAGGSPPRLASRAVAHEHRGARRWAVACERGGTGVRSAANPENGTLERAPRFCLERTRLPAPKSCLGRTRLPAPWSCLGRTRLLGLPGLPGPSGRWSLRAHSPWGFRAHSPAGPPSSLPRGTSLLTPPLRRPTGWRRGSRRWGRGGRLPR